MERESSFLLCSNCSPPDHADVVQFQTAAWGSYNVTMISEVVPGPKSMLFFALFNCVGKTSGFIGPFISSAIIKADGGNNHTAYWFMLGTALIGIAILYFVDPDQAKIDSAKCKSCIQSHPGRVVIPCQFALF
jgi:hypothetical protein